MHIVAPTCSDRSPRSRANTYITDINEHNIKAAIGYTDAHMGVTVSKPFLMVIQTEMPMTYLQIYMNIYLQGFGECRKVGHTHA